MPDTKGRKRAFICRWNFVGGCGKNGPDIITHLNGLDGQSNLLRSVVSQSFEQQVELKEVIKKIAASIEGVGVNPDDINVDGKTGYSGIVASGNARAVLDKLGQQYGFNWFIEMVALRLWAIKKPSAIQLCLTVHQD